MVSEGRIRSTFGGKSSFGLRCTLRDGCIWQTTVATYDKIRKLSFLETTSRCSSRSIQIPEPTIVAEGMETGRNLSHNLLSGTIGNVFTGLWNLREIMPVFYRDLSYNNFTGDLPSSFGSLMNLTGLNIQENYFSGIISKHFQSIPNLRIWRNKFHTGDNSSTWDFLLEMMPIEKSVSSRSSSIQNYPPSKRWTQENTGTWRNSSYSWWRNFIALSEAANALLALRNQIQGEAAAGNHINSPIQFIEGEKAADIEGQD
ncbi:hypothetical protein FNV43_RR16273 [Rhamnella rubrinervis]|uniref:Uncharacterized protein n=1 Tax=Rhamnella rubrinervis TaxID=2594499 RepID=A0A8K0EDT0_9ROSA|nr:hypothetical protein FNV43_RR16273 [Rhamnella rubrinervis]